MAVMAASSVTSAPATAIADIAAEGAAVDDGGAISNRDTQRGRGRENRVSIDAPSGSRWPQDRPKKKIRTSML